jgi:precorrin-6B C5,15-methyltransferase / cobalt-precorrin-6B C5,C15-methyltransferase
VSVNPVSVIGVGADGWDGLGPVARSTLLDADVVIGAVRHLALLPETVTAARAALPTPLRSGLSALLADHGGRRAAVLASGDPMYFGVGALLVDLLGAAAVRIVPHVSSISLACARLGWSVPDVEVVSLVGRPLALLHPTVQPGHRVLALVAAGGDAARICELLRHRGFADSEVTVLERLGATDERRCGGRAADWTIADHDPLAIVAIECRARDATVSLPRTPGLPDDAFVHDGQITKREIRAMVMSALGPTPGQLLWDVGAGSGSVGIEWMRSHPTCRAVAIEPREDRRHRIADNAERLGVPGLRVVAGSAPDALADLPTPDAIFVGGGVSRPGVIDACVAALPAGGRLVANAVTIEAEGVLAVCHARLGGELTRVAIQRADPLGGLTAWRPAMPVTQWSYRRGSAQ